MMLLEMNFEKGWRGGERQTLYNMTGFRQANLEVHLLCRKGMQLEAKALQANFTVHSFSNIFGVLFFLLAKGHRYQLMHVQTSQLLTYAVFLKPFHRAKVVFSRRVNFVPKGFFTRLKYLHADAIAAVSNSVKNIIEEFTKRNDVLLIPDIVVKKDTSTKKPDELLSRLNLSRKKIIATTAAMTQEKGPLVCLEALAMLMQKRDDIIFLHFGDGPLMEQMQQAIEDHKLVDRYLLMGHVDNVEQYFSKFDAFVITSLNEGLCSSVLDAFVYRVPVVATQAGGLADLVQPDRAVACETGNAAMIAEGIDATLNNKEQTSFRIENAYNFAQQHYSMQEVTDQYLQLFSTLLKQPFAAWKQP